MSHLSTATVSFDDKPINRLATIHQRYGQTGMHDRTGQRSDSVGKRFAQQTETTSARIDLLECSRLNYIVYISTYFFTAQHLISACPPPGLEPVCVLLRRTQNAPGYPTVPTASHRKATETAVIFSIWLPRVSREAVSKWVSV